MSKAQPIAFSPDVARLIRYGVITQTRRLMTPQPECGSRYTCDRWANRWHAVRAVPCPYGAKGDLLWVTEPWAVNSWNGWFPEGSYASVEYSDGRRYRPLLTTEHDAQQARDALKVINNPAFTMPMWASRTVLEIVDVGIERLRARTEAGARARTPLVWCVEFKRLERGDGA